jgi:hypothetical protein
MYCYLFLFDSCSYSPIHKMTTPSPPLVLPSLIGLLSVQFLPCIMCHLLLYGSLWFDTDGHSRFFWNFSTCLLNYMLSHPRRSNIYIHHHENLKFNKP